MAKTRAGEANRAARAASPAAHQRWLRAQAQQRQVCATAGHTWIPLSADVRLCPRCGAEDWMAAR